MFKSKDIQILQDVFRQHSFVMTTAELTSEKLYYADIQKMMAGGLIEKVKRGYYHWIYSFDGSEIAIINTLFPDAILCMETALFYYEYSDRNPAEWNLAISKNVSKQRTKIDYPFVKAYRLEPYLLCLGETSGKIDYTDIRIYDRDRTICDCLKNMKKMDKEIFNKAIQNYVKDPKKNVPNLINYAKEMRIHKRVKELIGVWL